MASLRVWTFVASLLAITGLLQSQEIGDHDVMVIPLFPRESPVARDNPFWLTQDPQNKRGFWDKRAAVKGRGSNLIPNHPRLALPQKPCLGERRRAMMDINSSEETKK